MLVGYVCVVGGGGGGMLTNIIQSYYDVMSVHVFGGKCVQREFTNPSVFV